MVVFVPTAATMQPDTPYVISVFARIYGDVRKWNMALLLFQDILRTHEYSELAIAT